jgi:hypothetical protein
MVLLSKGLVNLNRGCRDRLPAMEESLYEARKRSRLLA